MALPGIGTGLTQFESRYLTSATLVREVMIGDPIQVAEDEAVEEAARVMNVNRISSLLVMRAARSLGSSRTQTSSRRCSSSWGRAAPGSGSPRRSPTGPASCRSSRGPSARLGQHHGGRRVALARRLVGSCDQNRQALREQILAAVAELPGVKVLDIREQVARRAAKH